MELLTQEVGANLPPRGSTDDKKEENMMVHTHYFSVSGERQLKNSA